MPFQSLTIDPSFPADWRALLDAALPTLEYVVGEPAEEVFVEWRVATNMEGEPSAQLRLTEAGVCREELFAKAEFADAKALYWRLSGLWHRIMRTRLKLIWKSVQDSLADPVGA